MSSLKLKSLRTTLGLLVLSAGALALGGGCTSSEVVNTGKSTQTITGFCEQLAKAECSDALVTACYSSASETDVNSCIDAASEVTRCNPSGLTYHPDLAGDALETITEIYADGVLESAELPKLQDALDLVFYTGLADGSLCQVDSDCDVARGATCNFKGEQGKCGATQPVAPAAVCAGANQSCGEGYYCAHADGSFACLKTRNQGEACTYEQQCDSRQALTCQGGKCGLLLANAQACGEGSECAGGFCIRDEVTDKAGKCASQDAFNSFSTSCNPYLLGH